MSEIFGRSASSKTLCASSKSNRARSMARRRLRNAGRAASFATNGVAVVVPAGADGDPAAAPPAATSTAATAAGLETSSVTFALPEKSATSAAEEALGTVSSLASTVAESGCGDATPIAPTRRQRLRKRSVAALAKAATVRRKASGVVTKASGLALQMLTRSHHSRGDGTGGEVSDREAAMFRRSSKRANRTVVKESPIKVSTVPPQALLGMPKTTTNLIELGSSSSLQSRLSKRRGSLGAAVVEASERSHKQLHRTVKQQGRHARRRGGVSLDDAPTIMLLYLNRDTFVGAAGDHLAHEVRCARANGFPLALIHEADTRGMRRSGARSTVDSLSRST